MTLNFLNNHFLNSTSFGKNVSNPTFESRFPFFLPTWICQSWSDVGRQALHLIRKFEFKYLPKFSLEPWCRTVVAAVVVVIVDVFQGSLTTLPPLLAGGKCQWYEDDISVRYFFRIHLFLFREWDLKFVINAVSWNMREKKRERERKFQNSLFIFLLCSLS